MENKKSLKEFLKKQGEKKESKKEEFSISPTKIQEKEHKDFQTPKIAKPTKLEEKVDSLKKVLKKEDKIKPLEKKYEFDIKEIEEIVYEKRKVLFNFVASYFLYLELSSVSKVTKEMPYGEPFPVEWFQGDAIIGEPLTGKERYEFFIGKDGRVFMQIKGVGDKFERIVNVLNYIIQNKEKGINLIENYGKEMILFATSMKKDPSLKYEECIPHEMNEEEREIYEEMFLKIIGEREIEKIEEKEEEEKIIHGIKFKPLLKKIYIGNPFNLLYSSFPEIKEIYKEYGEKIHTFINDLCEILVSYDLCFDRATWEEIEKKFPDLKENIVPKILKDVKKNYKEEYEKFISKIKKMKTFVRENLKEKEKILINIIDFIIASYIIIKGEKF
ncbi:MAG: hypothetical protein ABIM41_06865 [candidate division WOR-3 bacterium]